ncbi:hypothetical protein MAM1_0275c09100 [Mucor ambiguus]|uniref:DUF7082 domain-containing protein n=1 Tax=Mucor ambiguus TaxID=91626 RepID=A0A0C9LX32_9FUNG|nr:hypothetical protein MAM1_0275c09100 [Mucor ambiguus]
MTVVDTDLISVVDDKRSMNIELSDSLFDYDMLLKDVDDSNSSAHKEADELFQGMFTHEAHDLNSISNLSSSASSSPQQLVDLQKRPTVMQWGPQDGQESCTIVSVVLQHHQEAAPMKIVFGTMTVETAQQQHIVANSSNSDNSDCTGGNSVWITLTASVPPLKNVCSGSNQVRISVCLFDRNDPDLAVDTWDVGHFTYLEEEQVITGSNGRKRALSCEPEECAQKKHTYDVKAQHKQQQTHSEDVNSQLLKLLAPYDPLLTVNHSESNAATRTNVWLSPTSSSDSSISNSLAPQNQSNYSTSVPPTFPLTVNHMMLQQGLLNSKRSQQHQHLANSNPLDMAHKHDMYRMYSNMQHQQQRHNPYLMHQHYSNQPTYMSHAMSNYIQSMNNSHHNNNNNNSNNNNSVLYSMSEHQQQTQQYQHIQQHSLSTPYMSSSSSIASHVVPRRASAPSTTSYTTTNSNSCALNKAHLKLNGDLMDMVTNWSVPEWHSGRRLVHFWRRTTTGADGNLAMVECGFEPMDQQLYHQQRMRDNVAAVAAAAAAAAAVSSNSSPVNIKSSTMASSGTGGIRHGGGGGANNTAPIVISCIYWRERNDYFITSVDCIYLLESLIGIQFTVEEKNRIRRNLEGFRPLTVSKCKTECADFFKLIMSFPHPKPRNIEKDVKVFSWKTLPHALRKIIRKYTPSYIASTPLEPIHPQQQQTSNLASSSSASHLHHSSINKF